MTIVPIKRDDCHWVFHPYRGGFLRPSYHTALISAGRISPAAPCSANVAREVSGVIAGLISTTAAPRRKATRASDAAGSTRLDVPIEKKTSQVLAACAAASKAAGGSISPNHTTAGRRYAPQRGQC